ncbi:uncharacterized protein [Diadema antillarum]|uniref:uncharacterized protein isoform X2 n=1 Tax=Diadema antillarum TaxID=105358 RepID=UPI003A88F6D6
MKKNTVTLMMDRQCTQFPLLVIVTASMIYQQITEASVLATSPTFRVWTREDVRLPCDFEGAPLAAAWFKETVSHQHLKSKKASFFDGNFASTEERFQMDTHFGLVITNLQAADEGLFYCQILLKNFEVFTNSTFLTVSSMASKHAIMECVEKQMLSQSQCTYIPPSTTSSVNLTCVVSGFKPNISMLWFDEFGKRLFSATSRQTTRQDATYERFETITVSAKLGAERTFVCSASGDSLNGTSTTEIIVLPSSGTRDNLGLIIGLAIGVPVVLAVLFLLVGKIFQRYHPEYLPRKGCGWNPCWRRPDQTEQSDQEEELESLNPLQNQRDELRQKIKEFVPSGDLGKTTSKVNISFFGKTAAGKSCLINSLIFALTGEYSTVTEENDNDKGIGQAGGKTRHRFHHILADKIDLIDSCCIPDFFLSNLKRLKEELNQVSRGKRNGSSHCFA